MYIYTHGPHPSGDPTRDRHSSCLASAVSAPHAASRIQFSSPEAERSEIVRQSAGTPPSAQPAIRQAPSEYRFVNAAQAARKMLRGSSPPPVFFAEFSGGPPMLRGSSPLPVFFAGFSGGPPPVFFAGLSGGHPSVFVSGGPPPVFVSGGPPPVSFSGAPPLVSGFGSTRARVGKGEGEGLTSAARIPTGVVAVLVGVGLFVARAGSGQGDERPFLGVVAVLVNVLEIARVLVEALGMGLVG